jgi:hypothetical protein
MNKISMLIWEESVRGFGTRPDGCSMHLDSVEMSKYVDSIYGLRSEQLIPDEYERILGSEISAFVDDSLFFKIKESGSVRLDETSMRNLISMEELIIKDSFV